MRIHFIQNICPRKRSLQNYKQIIHSRIKKERSCRESCHKVPLHGLMILIVQVKTIECKQHSSYYINIDLTNKYDTVSTAPASHKECTNDACDALSTQADPSNARSRERSKVPIYHLS